MKVWKGFMSLLVVLALLSCAVGTVLGETMGTPVSDRSNSSPNDKINITTIDAGKISKEEAKKKFEQVIKESEEQYKKAMIQIEQRKSKWKNSNDIEINVISAVLSL